MQRKLEQQETARKRLEELKRRKSSENFLSSTPLDSREVTSQSSGFIASHDDNVKFSGYEIESRRSKKGKNTVSPMPKTDGESSQNYWTSTGTAVLPELDISYTSAPAPIELPSGPLPLEIPPAYSAQVHYPSLSQPPPMPVIYVEPKSDQY